MNLDTQQQMLIEQRISNDAKSPLLAYLLWIFVGGLGIHRFYLGKTGTGITMLVLAILGAVTLPIGIGLILLAALGIWMLVDLFLIPGMVNEQRNQLRDKLTSDFTAASSRT
ncbi:TM2 domain-containing protein [Paracoccus sp. (in: a-proteobacteria)]|uniref:TM2 domain-containing protein n=1 Tax=Paracoccus sp. TaxID=267 RepID=UPI00289DC646|nr:TM2 domain-containing protein [Paracoccus sp. (in: a-proteobacteria)]